MENLKKYTSPTTETMSVLEEINVCSYEYSGSTIGDITEKDLSGGWQ